MKIEGRLKSEYYVASIVHIYRKAIDDYIENKGKYDPKKYMDEIEKVKTRNLTTFYFHNKDRKENHQDDSSRLYNENYEYVAKVVEDTLKDGYALVEIKNKLQKGDEIEVLIPTILEGQQFEVISIQAVETREELEEINPGRKDQMIYLKTPIKLREGFVIRRKIKN